jgi:hypothetical protein
MAADPRSSATYVMAGPFTYFTRDHSGDQTHLSAIIEDGRAAIQLALRWYITNETSFAFASANILNQWASTLTLINGNWLSLHSLQPLRQLNTSLFSILGTDVQLGASLSGVNLVNAAEIQRYTFSSWQSSSITTFSNMINNLFVPAAQVQGLAVYPFSGNWGTTGEKALIAYGVFLDNTTIYNLGKSYYETGNPNNEAACGCLPYMIPTTTGQYVESGRDQGHTQFSLGNSTF